MSIIAIFLALAVGIVVGTTALNGPVLDGLKMSVSNLTGDKRSLEGSVSDLRARAAKDNEFAQLTAPELLRSTLTGQRVLLVSTPDAPGSLRDDLAAALTTAGATITTDVRLRPDLVDPATTATLERVVAKVAPTGLDLGSGTPADRAGVEIAAALTKSSPGLVPALATRVVSGFADADLLDIPARPVDTSATLVLVVTGAAPGKVDDASSARSTAELAVVSAFASRVGVVLAGPDTSAEDGALLSALRSGSLKGRVSSVDDADRPQGQVASILALRDLLTGQMAGSYGTGRGATATSPVPRSAR